MKQSSRHGENGQDNLGCYLCERPELLLKTLDIAERCWHESDNPSGATPERACSRKR